MPFLSLLSFGGNRDVFIPSGGAAGADVLVYTLEASSGDCRSPSFQPFGQLSESNSGITATSYSTINQNIDWKSITWTGVNRRWVQFKNNRTTTTQDVLASLCNNYSSWPMANSSNRWWTSNGVGSSNRVLRRSLWQHNNSGASETHDIATLADSHYVWSNGMVWGNIDSTGNYGGILNTVYKHSGSGGGNTGEKLLVYVSDAYCDADSSQFTNYLTPTGPLGNAQNFTWDYDGSSGGVGGSPSNLADAISRTSTSSWPSYGLQQHGGSSYRWIEVELPQKVAFDYTWAVGYPNGSHYGNRNWVEGSNDGTNFTRLAEWRYHNGSRDSNGYLYYNAGGHTYDNTVNNVTKWHPMYNPDPDGYKWYRLSGDGWNDTNGYQLVFNWGLMKRTGDADRTVNPLDNIPGLQVYLDANQPDSYSGSGSTWYDLSGNGNHFDVEDGSPTWYRGYWYFDGNDSFQCPLSRGSGWQSIDDGYTLFFTAESDQSGSSWYCTTSTGDGNNYIDMWQRTSTRAWGSDADGHYPEPYGDMYELGWMQYCHRVDRTNGNSWIFHNGDLISTQTTSRTQKSATSRWTIGRRPDSSAYYWTGYVKNLLFFNRVLTDEEVRIVNAYISSS